MTTQADVDHTHNVFGFAHLVHSGAQIGVGSLLSGIATYPSWTGRGRELALPENRNCIDLLFYHVRLHRYFVFELNVGAFQPERAGKLGFYLAAVNGTMRTLVERVSGFLGWRAPSLDSLDIIRLNSFKTFVEREPADNLHVQSLDPKREWIDDAIRGNWHNYRWHQESTSFRSQPAIAYFLCNREVVLPSLAELFRLEPFNEVFRYVYREKLVPIWQPIPLADMN
jgi:hypothetical protein